MTWRSDHVAGAAFVLLGLMAFVLGGDLPFGSLSGPGAGMMPKLVGGLLICCAGITMAAGAQSPPLADVDWSDKGHAFLVVLVTGMAAASYETLGFLLTMFALVFALLIVVERRNVIVAAVYSVAVTLFAYWLFGVALKTPLQRGLFWL